jgi:response regulator NasT
VELIALHTPDLAILDVKMPGLDGIEAARRVVAEHDVAVLLLTAFSQRDLIEQAREAGVSAYLVKPFRKAELIPAVHAALLAAREERALAVEDDVSAVAEDKLETRRLVDQAKGLLMDAHGMAEEEAFSFIQQTAMQTRARMRDVATAIVEGTLTP